jgi:hypothetical protein
MARLVCKGSWEFELCVATSHNHYCTCQNCSPSMLQPNYYHLSIWLALSKIFTRPRSSVWVFIPLYCTPWLSFPVLFIRVANMSLCCGFHYPARPIRGLVGWSSFLRNCRKQVCQQVTRFVHVFKSGWIIHSFCCNPSTGTWLLVPWARLADWSAFGNGWSGTSMHPMFPPWVVQALKNKFCVVWQVVKQGSFWNSHCCYPGLFIKSGWSL